jgi:hypothetical protein
MKGMGETGRINTGTRAPYDTQRFRQDKNFKSVTYAKSKPRNNDSLVNIQSHPPKLAVCCTKLRRVAQQKRRKDGKDTPDGQAMT